MPRNDPQVNFRIEKSLMDWLRQNAKDNRRSITAQLSIILEQERERCETNKKAD